MTCINATTKQQISVYSILIVICLLVPLRVNQLYPPLFQMWGVQKFFFRSLHSRITFCSRTFRTVVLPLQLWSERVKEAAWQLCARGHARIRVVIELLSVVTPFAPVLDMYRHRLLLCTDDGKYFGSNQVDSALTYVFINQFESNRFTARPVLTRFISNLTD